MEDDEVSALSASSATTTENKTLGEILDDLCAYYMSIGVSYEDFWHGDYTQLKYYLKAWQIKQNREFEQANERLYLAGLYNYRAFSAVMDAFGWALGGKKGKQPDGYLDYPIAITEDEKRREKERNTQKTLAWFMQGQRGGKNGKNKN